MRECRARLQECRAKSWDSMREKSCKVVGVDVRKSCKVVGGAMQEKSCKVVGVDAKRPYRVVGVDARILASLV
jgi:hypothetical protein